MWRTLQQWVKASGFGTAPRKLLEEMREVRSLDVLLPSKDKTIRLSARFTPRDITGYTSVLLRPAKAVDIYDADMTFDKATEISIKSDNLLRGRGVSHELRPQNSGPVTKLKMDKSAGY
jgi:hypothetical protein